MAVGLGASSLESSMTLAATMNVPRYRFSWLGALLTRFSSLPVGPTLCLILLSSGLVCHSVWADESATQLPSQIRVIELPPSLVSTSSPLAIAKPLAAIHHSGRANFGDEPASPDARHVADWVVDSGNNGRRPFAIVDKVAAKVFVFNAQGDLRGAAPVLLGLARASASENCRRFCPRSAPHLPDVLWRRWTAMCTDRKSFGWTTIRPFPCIR